MSDQKRIIVGVTGATGIVYAIKFLEVLKQLAVETHLVVTKTGEMTRGYETTLTAKALRELADVHYNVNDLGAVISSGSFKTMGMIVAPCSMRSLAEIATGLTSNLLTRAADVVLKERRKLILLTREFPLTGIHLKNMLTVTEMGGIIAPPVPAFYTKPETIDDIVMQTVGRTLDLFDFDAPGFKRWNSGIHR